MNLIGFSLVRIMRKFLNTSVLGMGFCVLLLVTYDQWRTREFCSGRRGKGGSTNSVEDRGQRERGSGDGSHLFRGSGGSCNLVQEIEFHIVKFS